MDLNRNRINGNLNSLCKIYYHDNKYFVWLHTLCVTAFIKFAPNGARTEIQFKA